MADPDLWQQQRETLGSFIRNQRQLAKLSLRQLAELAKISNPYLSQLERGLHEPSMRVLQGLAEALGVSVDTMLAHAGVLPDRVGEGRATLTEDAIRADSLLSDEQKEALLSVYRSYVAVGSSQTRTQQKVDPTRRPDTAALGGRDSPGRTTASDGRTGSRAAKTPARRR